MAFERAGDVSFFFICNLVEVCLRDTVWSGVDSVVSYFLWHSSNLWKETGKKRKKEEK